MSSSTEDYIVRKATLLQNRAHDIQQQQLQQQASQKQLFCKKSYQTGEMCWIYRSWKLCWSTWICFRLCVSLSENNNSKPLSNMSWNNIIYCKTSKSCTIYLPPEGDLTTPATPATPDANPQKSHECNLEPIPIDQPQPTSTGCG
jgi:hypothetical protein